LDELLAYAILRCEGIVTEEEYQERLHALFLEHPEDRILLDLECETDIQKAVIYVRTWADYGHIGLHPDIFGRALMDKLKDYYSHCTDLRQFGKKLYSIWTCLPGYIQSEEPFWSLCHAGDPLSWGDEVQTRSLYEQMFSYYEGRPKDGADMG
jgi:hypothetical protein